ncbi:MAG TPA: RNA 2',3'-cyclic phosphodiesterase [Ktedonobacterales bacterium]
MTRTFIAVELDEEVRAYLEHELRRLSALLPQVRWVDPATLHLTLAFLGELDDQRLAQATEAALETARQGKPFTLRLSSLGTFGPRYQPRVVWVGIAGNLPRLLELQAALVASLTSRAFPPEERAYSPHLTLARLKDPLSKPDLATLQRILASSQSAQTASSHASSSPKSTPPALPVAQISVMKSESFPGGPHYTCLQSCPLG